MGFVQDYSQLGPEYCDIIHFYVIVSVFNLVTISVIFLMKKLCEEQRKMRKKWF